MPNEAAVHHVATTSVDDKSRCACSPSFTAARPVRAPARRRLASTPPPAPWPAGMSAAAGEPAAGRGSASKASAAFARPGPAEQRDRRFPVLAWVHGYPTAIVIRVKSAMDSGSRQQALPCQQSCWQAAARTQTHAERATLPPCHAHTHPPTQPPLTRHGQDELQCH